MCAICRNTVQLLPIFWSWWWPLTREMVSALIARWVESTTDFWPQRWLLMLWNLAVTAVPLSRLYTYETSKGESTLKTFHDGYTTLSLSENLIFAGSSYNLIHVSAQLCLQWHYTLAHNECVICCTQNDWLCWNLSIYIESSVHVNFFTYKKNNDNMLMLQ